MEMKGGRAWNMDFVFVCSIHRRKKEGMHCRVEREVGVEETEGSRGMVYRR